MTQNADVNINDGMSQAERSSLYLDPAYFKIDDRATEDFLAYTIESSRLFNYYNHNNLIEGDWEDFFTSDIDVMLTLISSSKLKEVIRRFDGIISRFDEVNEEHEIIPVLNDSFTLLYDMVVLFQKYRDKLSTAYNDNRMVGLLSIAKGFDKDFENFIAGYSGVSKAFSGIKEFDVSRLQQSGQRYLNPTPPKALFDDQGDKKKQVASIRAWIDNLFSSLRLKFSNLISAVASVEQRQWKGDVHDPHIGLFVTFLNIYKYLQNKINRLNAKHLEYYYHNIIGIPYKRPLPDKMHVLFQAAPIKKQVYLAAGEYLVAEVPGTKEALQYRLQNDAVITQSEVMELKTCFISQMKQFAPGMGNYEQVKELRIFKADNPVVKPKEFESTKNNYKPWPLLGEEQNNLTSSQRTMEDASVGLIIASPLFYARDGKRTFEIKFYLTPASFRVFEEYRDNLSLAVHDYKTPLPHSKELIEYKMLDKSFLVRVTGVKEWIQVRKYSIRVSREPGEKYIQLKFALNDSEASIDVYNATVHGAGYNLDTPAVELVLNNDLFHHPYSFYRNFLLERISITTNVTGSRDVRLQNSFGPLSASVPFQLFGPLPSVGSYLDIRNTNVFNRFTTHCSIHLDWFDLPKEHDGFETYFKGYNNGVKNDSFRVAITPLQATRQMTERSIQETFPLFETVRTDTGQVLLSNETVFEDVDCSQFGFRNSPLLDEESTETQTSDGVVRIEFVAPDDGFGHRLYPQILPAIISRNVRKDPRKYPIPNIPYIPVVKSVLMDYTLEHTEVLKTGKHNEEHHTIHLIHIHPFGFDAVYPEKESTDMYLVPPLSDESNLLIGLSQVEPGQELSVLFQLEEMSFHHTAHSTAPVHWSYLQNNRWMPLKANNILGDSTNHFVNSGIIQITIPRDISNGNTILNRELYWLKASSTGHTAGSRVIGVFTQACLAVLEAAKEESTVFDSLPPGSLKGFGRKIPDIVNLWQLFSTFGGRQKEGVQDYRVRVSERLRHKDRLMTALDISQMILDAFPAILMVKCFGRSISKNLILPGINLQIIVIPKERADGRFISEEPKVSLALLLKIKEFIDDRLSSFARAEVGNPVYEKVKIVCSVWIEKRRLNSNDGYYINLLNEDIKKFITPWLFDDGQELKIGGRIYLSDILDYIKKRPYIGYVTGFSVLHLYKKYNPANGKFDATVTDSCVNLSDYIEVSRPDAILISSSRHIIHLLNNQAYVKPVRSGLGDLQIGNELPLLKNGADKSSADDRESLVNEEDHLDFNFNF